MFIKQRLPLFVIIVFLQLVGALYMPVRAMIIRSTGKEIALQLAPVDPYDFLTGYSVSLSYKASQWNSYPQAFKPKFGQTVYALLEKDSGPVWQPKELLSHKPERVAANQVVLKGKYQSGQWSNTIAFGVESFYIPESKREEINEAINRRFVSNGQQFVMPADFARAYVKVDDSGNASLVKLYVDSQVYE